MTPPHRSAGTPGPLIARPDQPPAAESRTEPARPSRGDASGRARLLRAALGAVAGFLVLVALLSIGVCLALGYVGPP